MTWSETLAAKLETGKLHTLQVEPDTKALSRRLVFKLRQEIGYDERSYAFLREDWWRWDPVATVLDPQLSEDSFGGERRPIKYDGRVVRRLTKALKVRLGANVNSDLSARLGSLIASWTSGDGLYHFDFTTEIDWSVGDFGDHGSCFWSDRSVARAALMNDAGFRAMRFYAPNAEEVPGRTYGTGYGVGRAWILLRSIGQRGTDEYPFVFNGYWYAAGDRAMNHDQTEESDATWMAAKVLAAHIGEDAEPTRVRAINGQSWDGKLYINAGRAVMVAPPGIAETLTQPINFRVAINVPTCSACRRGFRNGIGVYSDPRPGHEYEEARYCAECFNRYFPTCPDCGTRVYQYDMLRTPTGRTVCHACYSKLYYTCGTCGIPKRREAEAPVELSALGGLTCPRCVQKLQWGCANCNVICTAENSAPFMTDFVYRQRVAGIAADQIMWQCMCHMCLGDEAARARKRCCVCGCYTSATRLTYRAENNGFLCDVCLGAALQRPLGRILRGSCWTCARRTYAVTLDGRRYRNYDMDRLCPECYAAAEQREDTRRAQVAQAVAQEQAVRVRTQPRDERGRFRRRNVDDFVRGYIARAEAALALENAAAAQRAADEAARQRTLRYIEPADAGYAE